MAGGLQVCHESPDSLGPDRSGAASFEPRIRFAVLGSGEARDALLRHLARLEETAEEARLAPGDRRAVLARIEEARTAAARVPREDRIHVL